MGTKQMTFAESAAVSFISAMGFVFGVVHAILMRAKNGKYENIGIDAQYRRSIMLTLDWGARAFAKQGDHRRAQKSIDLLMGIQRRYPDCHSCKGHGVLIDGQPCLSCYGTGTSAHAVHVNPGRF